MKPVRNLLMVIALVFGFTGAGVTFYAILTEDVDHFEPDGAKGYEHSTKLTERGKRLTLWGVGGMVASMALAYPLIKLDKNK